MIPSTMASKRIKYLGINLTKDVLTFTLKTVVRCMRQGTRGWCTGMTLREGMGREVGGRVRMGTHVHPWLIHVNVWQKKTTIL